mgnify:CR=1 FL=1
MTRAITRIILAPPLVLASAATGAIMGAALAVGWILLRRDEGLCWLTGDDIP